MSARWWADQLIIVHCCWKHSQSNQFPLTVFVTFCWYFFVTVDIEEITGKRHNALGIHDVITFICVHILSPPALSCIITKPRLHTNLLRNRHGDEIWLGRVDRGSRRGITKHSPDRLYSRFWRGQLTVWRGTWWNGTKAKCFLNRKNGWYTKQR